MKKSLVLSVASLSFLLAACGGGSGAVAPSANSEQPPVVPESDVATEPAEDALAPAGEFRLVSMTGADITFNLPTPATDQLVADIEQFRKDIGAEPVSYLVADIDNRNGAEYINMYSVSAYDAEGTKYEFTSASEAISEWGPEYTEDYDYVLPDGTKLGESEGEKLNSRSTDLHNEYLDGVDPSERGKMVLISEDAKLPTEFTRVAVQPSGGMAEGEDAFSISEDAKG